MRSGKWYLLHILLLSAVVGGFVGTGCKKYDAPVNNNVIQTPYPLYFADKLGALYNTNDGKAYKIVFPADGVAARALATSGTNIMFIKYNGLINPNGTLFLSADNGMNFNPLDKTVNPIVTWQNQIMNTSWDFMYLASVAGNSVEVSKNHGLSWSPDATFGTAGVSIQSFTQTTDGKLYALDYNSLRLFMTPNQNTGWSEVTGVVTPLPAGKFQLAHFNTGLVAADLDGTNGIYYSNDGGINWTQYTGIPANRKIFMVASPHDRVLLAGIEAQGIYRLVGNAFEASNNGLTDSSSVFSIVGKEDIYKNAVIKQYVYIATNKGLFRSEDLGQNWVLMRAGDYRNVY